MVRNDDLCLYFPFPLASHFQPVSPASLSTKAPASSFTEKAGALIGKGPPVTRWHLPTCPSFPVSSVLGPVISYEAPRPPFEATHLQPVLQIPTLPFCLLMDTMAQPFSFLALSASSSLLSLIIFKRKISPCPHPRPPVDFGLHLSAPSFMASSLDYLLVMPI